MRRDTAKNKQQQNNINRPQQKNNTTKPASNKKRKKKKRNKGKHRKMDHTLPATVTNSENAELTYMSSSSLN